MSRTIGGVRDTRKSLLVWLTASQIVRYGLSMSKKTKIKTTHDLASALTREKMRLALGVGRGAVDNAVVRGVFPPAWYMAIKDLAAKTGVDCPTELFKFNKTR